MFVMLGNTMSILSEKQKNEICETIKNNYSTNKNCKKSKHWHKTVTIEHPETSLKLSRAG